MSGPTCYNRSMSEKPKRRWFAFRLRTLLVATAALALVASQWRLVPEETIYAGRDGATVITRRPPDRFVIVVYIEGIAATLWWAQRRLRVKSDP